MSTESKIRYVLYVLLASFVSALADVLLYLIVPQSAIKAVISHSPTWMAIEILLLIFVFGPMCFYAADKIMGKPMIGISVSLDKEKS